MEQGNTKQKFIHVIATIEIVEGKREEYLAAFEEVVPLVLAEKGCIEYGTFVDIYTAIPI